jgi:transcriptional regulator with XRE-family HTH domain
MVTRERRADRGRRMARQRLSAIGDELREARLSAGLSQQALGDLVGVSHTEISRIELARHERVPYQTVAVIGAVLGLDVSIRAFPDDEPIRDAAQVALLGRLRSHVSAEIRWRAEVPIRLASDKRAWDVELAGAGWRVVADAESRLRDAQAVTRRVLLKARDDGADVVLLVVADSRHNRRVVRLIQPDLASHFPVSGRVILDALAQGQRPPGSGIVTL